MRINRQTLYLIIGAVLISLSAVVCAVAQTKKTPRPPQEESQEEGKSRAAPAPAASTTPAAGKEEGVRYSYEFSQPEFFVRHILIEHDAAGRGRVTFERKQDIEPLVEPLNLSAAALERITARWEALRFMESETNYQAEKQFPHLGTTRLRMSRGDRTRVAEFNWTADRDAGTLASEYRRVADQTMFVFEITVSRENQPLEAPKLLARLDTLLSRGGLSDPHQLVPLLRDLNTDERIPLIARNHAGRLLKKIEK